MTNRLFILIAIAVFMSGCRTPDPTIDLLEGELRWMEDQLYLMEDELKEKCDLLADCRQAGGDCNCQPQNASAFSSDREPTPADSNRDNTFQAPSDRPNEPSRRRQRATPVEDEDSSDLQEPTIELPSMPSPSAPKSSTPPPAIKMPDLPSMPSLPGKSSRSKPLLDSESPEPIPSLEIQLQSYAEQNADTEFELEGKVRRTSPTGQAPRTSRWEVLPLEAPIFVATPPRENDFDDWEILPLEKEDWDVLPLNNDRPEATVAPEARIASDDVRDPQDTIIDAHITHIVTNCYLNGGRDFEGRAMDPGLLMTVQPRNADGKYVALAAPLSIAVLDSSKEGSDARIARWDIPADEARRTIVQSAFGHGIHLALAWDKVPEDLNHLHVFARYETVDGRKLVTDQPVLTARPIDPKKSSGLAGKWTPASLKDVSHGSSDTRQVNHAEAPNGAEETKADQKMPNVFTTFETRPIDQNMLDSKDEPIVPKQPRLRQSSGQRPQWQPYR